MFKRCFIFFVVIIAIVTAGCSQKESVESKSVKVKDWKESSVFKSNGYPMIGEEERVGFIYNDSEVTKFYPHQEKKYMWHFWGDDQEFNGDFKVIGTHESSNEKLTVLEGYSLGGPNNGADRHVPTNFSLPKSGMWKLDAYIGDKLFGSVFIKVQKK